MTFSDGMIWIITGPREVGKTRFCMHLIDQAKQTGLHIAGLFCPPIFEGKIKTGIGIENLKSGEYFQLARVRMNEQNGLCTDHWIFDEKVMQWADQVFTEIGFCDLLMVDELGPLEFKRGAGWQNGLLAIDRGEYKTAVVVIRPELVTEACARWPKAKVLEIPAGMDEASESTLKKQVLQAIK